MPYKFIEGWREDDWVVYCDICETKCWASDTQRLAPETGRGGFLVCPDDLDATDYSLVPYKIPAERPVPFVNYLLPTSTSTAYPNYPSFNYETYDPLNPLAFYQVNNPWNVQTTTWDTWSEKWGA